MSGLATVVGSYRVAVQYTETRREVLAALVGSQSTFTSTWIDTRVVHGPPHHVQLSCAEGHVLHAFASDGPDRASRVLLSAVSLQLCDEYGNEAKVAGVQCRIGL